MGVYNRKLNKCGIFFMLDFQRGDIYVFFNQLVIKTMDLAILSAMEKNTVINGSQGINNIKESNKVTKGGYSDTGGKAG